MLPHLLLYCIIFSVYICACHAANNSMCMYGPMMGVACDFGFDKPALHGAASN